MRLGASPWWDAQAFCAGCRGQVGIAQHRGDERGRVGVRAECSSCSSCSAQAGIPAVAPVRAAGLVDCRSAAESHTRTTPTTMCSALVSRESGSAVRNANNGRTTAYPQAETASLAPGPRLLTLMSTGQVTTVDKDNPGGDRAVSKTKCDRIYAAAGSTARPRHPLRRPSQGAGADVLGGSRQTTTSDSSRARQSS